ncbi:hypothetical protein P5673_007609, partial [Acropora cervicornis]
EWSEAHDIQLCRQIVVTNPASTKRKTSERKRLWETIAQNLEKINSKKFKTSLSECSMRERSELAVLLEELREERRWQRRSNFNNENNQRKIKRRPKILDQKPCKNCLKLRRGSQNKIPMARPKRVEEQEQTL